MRRKLRIFAGAGAIALLLSMEAMGANYGPGMGTPSYGYSGANYGANYGPGMNVNIYDQPANNPAYDTGWTPGYGPGAVGTNPQGDREQILCRRSLKTWKEAFSADPHL